MPNANLSYQPNTLGSRFTATALIRQRGMSLIELMVGIAIGLLVVTVAGGALMVSRGVSGTVSDASVLQQQASFAFRVIGQQLRQSGSLYLNTNTSKNTDTSIDQYALPVAFETVGKSTNSAYSFTPSKDSIQGSNTSISAAYRRYKELVFKQKDSDLANQSMSRDCQGGPADADTATNNSYMRIQSKFNLNGNKLECTGSMATSQPSPMLDNVANFRMRYLQISETSGGDPKTQYVNATSITNWGLVTGVEVCIVLYGNERMSLPEGTTYTDCDGVTSVDMSSTSLGTDRTQRMHMVFRSIYQLRSQGLMDKAL